MVGLHSFQVQSPRPYHVSLFMLWVYMLLLLTEDLEKFRLRRSHLLVNSTAAVATVIRN